MLTRGSLRDQFPDNTKTWSKGNRCNYKTNKNTKDIKGLLAIFIGRFFDQKEA